MKSLKRWLNFVFNPYRQAYQEIKLLAFQSDIQELQVQLLKIKLSCRELIMTTFTDEQWDNFAFIISDNPKLASLMTQMNVRDSK